MDRRCQVTTKRKANNQELGMKLFLASLVVVIAGVSMGGALGCKRGLTLSPVTGEVKLDGKPVADCAVAFTPVGGGPVASATTDAQGHFELQTVNRPGAVLGEHRVTVAKQYMKRDSRGAELGFEFLTPAKYARPDTSGITETVSHDENENKFVIEMTSH